MIVHALTPVLLARRRDTPADKQHRVVLHSVQCTHGRMRAQGGGAGQELAHAHDLESSPAQSSCLHACASQAMAHWPLAVASCPSSCACIPTQEEWKELLPYHAADVLLSAVLAANVEHARDASEDTCALV